MKLQPGETHKVSELTVNHDELLRIQAAYEEHVTESAKLYARLQTLINQGTIPSRNQTNAPKNS